jgi:hypothetical protein
MFFLFFQTLPFIYLIFTIAPIHHSTENWYSIQYVHRKKRFSTFPSPARMSLIKLSLGGDYDVIYKLFLPSRESLVSYPGWEREYRKAFFSVYGRHQSNKLCCTMYSYRTNFHVKTSSIHCIEGLNEGAETTDLVLVCTGRYFLG